MDIGFYPLYQRAAFCLLYNGDFEKALEGFELCLEKNPMCQYSLSGMGYVYSEMNRLVLAMTYRKKALLVKPVSEWNWLYLGSSYE